MYIIDYNKLFEGFSDEPPFKSSGQSSCRNSITASGTTTSTNWNFTQPKRYASELKEDTLELVFSIVGHNPKEVEVQLTADTIFIKAVKNKEDKSITSQLTTDINDSIKITNEFDALSAKAEIKNGLLHIVLQKKEDQKPKTINIKF